MSDSEVRKEQIRNDVIRIMAETLEISQEEIPTEIEPDAELPFDSLQLYEFVIDVEETYNIRLPDEILDEIKTVDDMVETIVRLSDSQ